MKNIKLFEEYRYFKINPSEDNKKDINEPFFNMNKKWYKLTYEEAKQELEDNIEWLNDSYYNVTHYLTVNNVNDFLDSIDSSIVSCVNAAAKAIVNDKWEEEKDYLNNKL